MKKTVIITILCQVFALSVQSQEPVIAHSTNWWNALVGHYRFSDKWGVYDELHIRRANYLSSWQQFLFRPGVNYFLNDNVTLTVGYTYIKNYRNDILPEELVVVPENNVWQQVFVKQKIGKVTLKHRYRFEERWSGRAVVLPADGYIIDGYNYSNRFRYRIILGIPLAEKWSVTLYNELFIAIDKKFMLFNFNQNWDTFLLNYKPNPSLKISGGIMYQYLRKPDGIHYEANPTIQFGIGYKLDFRKKEKQ